VSLIRAGADYDGAEAWISSAPTMCTQPGGCAFHPQTQPSLTRVQPPALFRVTTGGVGAPSTRVQALRVSHALGGPLTEFTRRRGEISTACLRTTPADPIRVASSRGPLALCPDDFEGDGG
jgi:hypothetical protein